MYGIKKNEMGPFDVQINCDLAYAACVNVVGKAVGIAGADIYKVNKKLMLALIWRMARFHYLSLLGSKQEKDILDWANGLAGSVCTIGGFGDAKLSTGRFIIKLCEALDPEVIDWEIVTPGETPEDAESNAKYAISLARKHGAFIFCVWDDVVNHNKKMMLILIAGVYDLWIQKNGGAAEAE